MKATEVTGVLRCKVAVCGDATVGKSSLISMLVSKGQKFPKTYTMTTGVEVTAVQVPIPDTTMLAELFLLDTSGSDLYKESLPQYWNGVYYAILVFDITSQESFDSCKAWNEELKKSRPDKERPLKAVLVAHKTDLPTQRHTVSLDIAESWATSCGMEFCSISSLPPGTGVEAPFVAIAKALHKTYEEKVATYVDASRNWA